MRAGPKVRLGLAFRLDNQRGLDTPVLHVRRSVMMECRKLQLEIVRHLRTARVSDAFAPQQ